MFAVRGRRNNVAVGQKGGGMQIAAVVCVKGSLIFSNVYYCNAAKRSRYQKLRSTIYGFNFVCIVKPLFVLRGNRFVSIGSPVHTMRFFAARRLSEANASSKQRGFCEAKPSDRAQRTIHKGYKLATTIADFTGYPTYFLN